MFDALNHCATATIMWPVITNGFDICYVKYLCVLSCDLSPVVEIWIILSGMFGVLHAIVPGNIIALRTPRESKVSFYLCIVNKIEKTTAQIFDVYQHIVLPGTLYLSCNYLTIHSEKSIRYIGSGLYRQKI